MNFPIILQPISIYENCLLPNGNKYEIDYMYGQIYWFVFTEIDGKISEEQKARKEFFSRKNPILAVKNN